MLSTRDSLVVGEGGDAAHGARLDQRVGDHAPPAGDTGPGAVGDEVPGVNEAHLTYQIVDEPSGCESLVSRSTDLQPDAERLANRDGCDCLTEYAVRSSEHWGEGLLACAHFGVDRVALLAANYSGHLRWFVQWLPDGGADIFKDLYTAETAFREAEARLLRGEQ